MQYNDFSSLVQLGVGLHVGAALLQLYGELGVQPLARTIMRTRALFLDESDRPPKDLENELSQLESEYEIFKIELFNEYKRYVKINAYVAAALAGALVLISYMGSDNIPVILSLLFVVFSLLPAPVTLLALWRDASRKISPMKQKADGLEKRALKRFE